MRIISGDFRGRKLNTPKDYQVRPTTDKVKEALFNILAPELYNSVVCDLFAGTGNLGLEALSRGARKCYFGDHASESIKLIKENIAMCRADDMSEVVAGDYIKTLDNIHETVNIFFLDPPYRKDLLEKSIRAISDMGLLAEDGVIVAEHNKQKDIPAEIGTFSVYKERRYGSVILSFYKETYEIEEKE
jgi:16S rRNA (guanine(966)-N(2))-methyltransferase RsmD